MTKRRQLLALIPLQAVIALIAIRTLQRSDPALHVVICTAHSDRTWDEIAAVLTARDRWAVLKKPFDKVEVVQLAHVLTAKWQLGRAATAHLGG